MYTIWIEVDTTTAHVLAKRARERDTETGDGDRPPACAYQRNNDATTGASCKCSSKGGGSVEPESNTGFITITSRRHS